MDARAVVIINQNMARRCFRDEDPIGKRINFFSEAPKEKDWTTVVGVVGDVKDTPEDHSAQPAFWWHQLQRPFNETICPSSCMRVQTPECWRTRSAAPSISSIPAWPSLAAAGIYGVISYSVNQQTREFGMRMALGAKPWDLLRLLLAQGLKLGAAGVALAIPCAAAASFGVSARTLPFPLDPHPPVALHGAGKNLTE